MGNNNLRKGEFMKFIDRIRDFLYDSIDYVFMFIIVLLVVGVIGWRLDILFANDALDIPQNPVLVDNSGRDTEEDDPIEEPGDEDPDGDTVDDPNAPSDPTTPTSPTPSGEIVKIVIPEGSLPNKIGLILQENGVVSSSRDFISKAVELHLDTKLKSGTFEIQKGLSLDQVVKIIARQN